MCSAVTSSSLMDSAAVSATTVAFKLFLFPTMPYNFLWLSAIYEGRMYCSSS